MKEKSLGHSPNSPSGLLQVDRWAKIGESVRSRTCGAMFIVALVAVLARPAASQQTILLDFETLASGAGSVTQWPWGTTTVTGGSIGNIVDTDILAAGGSGKGAKASGTAYGGTITLNGAVGTAITFLYGTTAWSPPNSGGFKGGVFDSDGVRGNFLAIGGTGPGYAAGPVTFTGHSPGNRYFNSFRWSTTFPGALAEIDNVQITVVPLTEICPELKKPKFFVVGIPLQCKSAEPEDATSNDSFRTTRRRRRRDI